jgi:deoxyribodipyrimidine photo-lyase
MIDLTLGNLSDPLDYLAKPRNNTQLLNPCSIVWFRNDLRVSDHAPLNQACNRNLPVVAMYVFDDRQYSKTLHYDFPKTGAHRAQFILESVAVLEQQLHHLGIPLLVSQGDTVDRFTELMMGLNQHGFEATTVYYSEESGQEERDLVNECKYHEKLQSLRWESYRTNDLYHHEDLPALELLPHVFTLFRKQIEGKLIPPAPLPAPIYDAKWDYSVFQSIRSLSHLPTVEELGLIAPMHDERNIMNWQGGSTSGQQRLHHFLFATDAIATYKLTRNGLLSTIDSSRLSSWLAQGCLSAREVYAAIHRYEQTRIRNESTYWLWFELLWREFFRLMHRKYPHRIFQREGIQQRKKSWSCNPRYIEAWLAGRTGYPLVDASMRELAITGYTSNRARQNAASFLTQSLNIDWLLGAEWYESQLIDYDPASNYGNWQYLAGVGNDARLDRRFHVVKQAQQYDPEQAYVRHWLIDYDDASIEPLI